MLDWHAREVEMPSGGEPVRRGFDRDLIELALPRHLDTETRLQLGPQAVSCRIAIPVNREEEPVDQWACGGERLQERSVPLTARRKADSAHRKTGPDRGASAWPWGEYR